MTLQAPRFSIIIPTFRAAKTIRRSLSSVTSQSCNQYEVLVMDGHSDDETANIVHEFSTRHPQIQFISEPDKGIYDAMNKGISRSKGEWLFFLGSDDSFFDDHVLSNVASAIDNEHADIFYGNVFSHKFNSIYDGPFDESKILKKNICHQSIFYHRSVFRKIGAFDISFKALADWDHNIRWFFDEKINKVYLDITIANYADGGYSTVIVDERFKALYHWQVGRAKVHRLNFLTRSKVVARELRRMYNARRWNEFKQILIQSPAFLIFKQSK